MRRCHVTGLPTPLLSLYGTPPPIQARSAQARQKCAQSEWCRSRQAGGRGLQACDCVHCSNRGCIPCAAHPTAPSCRLRPCRCCADTDCPNAATGQMCVAGTCSQKGCTLFSCWQGETAQLIGQSTATHALPPSRASRLTPRLQLHGCATPMLAYQRAPTSTQKMRCRE